jgi:hypothetical protein
LSDVTDAIGPALARHQLSYEWDIHQASNAITVDCILTHVQGHSKKVTLTAAPDNSGMKNAIQQVASTTTYLQRYTLLAITGMSTKGMDDDGRGTRAPDVDARIDDWVSAASAISSIEEYSARKIELLAAYGEQRKVPKPIQAAFASKQAELKASK